jgi:DNA-binding NtrC family response regulator
MNRVEAHAALDRELIRAALERNTTIEYAAADLGMHRSTFYDLCKKVGYSLEQRRHAGNVSWRLLGQHAS